MNYTDTLKAFQVHMARYYPEYSLTGSTKHTSSYIVTYPAQNPNAAAGCILLLLGVVPGILYFLFARTDAKTYTISFNVNEMNEYQITGYSVDINRIQDSFRASIS